MKYEYPKEIQIGAHKIEVNLLDCYTVDGHVRFTGESSLPGSKISISIKLPQGQDQSITFTNEVFWHEAIHLANDVFVIKLEEDQIERTAQAVTQILSNLGIQLIKCN